MISMNFKNRYVMYIIESRHTMVITPPNPAINCEASLTDGGRVLVMRSADGCS